VRFKGIGGFTAAACTPILSGMRRLLCLTALLAACPLGAEPVVLRKTGNPAVVTFEYITQDEESITVRLPGRDTVLVYRWEELDQEHAQASNPRVWEERKLLLQSTEEASMKKKDAAANDDPFAVAARPNSPQDLSRNLAGELAEGLKGISVNSAAFLCQEANIDTLVFWRTYDELRKLSGRPAGPDMEATKPSDDDPDPANAKSTPGNPQAGKASKAAKTKTAPRSPAQQAEIAAHTAKARADFENDVRPFSGAGYVKMLADTNKARFAWTVLRRASEDRRQIVAALRRQDAAAAELSERTADKAAKSEISVFRKSVATLADSLEKVTREATTMESGLINEAQAVVARLPR